MDSVVGLEEILQYAVREETPVEYKHFRGEELNGTLCEKVEMIGCTFQNCRLLSCDFSKAYLDRVSFVNCSLANSDFSHSFWKDSGIKDCGAQGMKLTDAALRKCSLCGCKLDYASFQQAQLVDTIVEQCSLVSAFLGETILKKVRFDRVRFESTDFYRTSFKGIDLSTCELIGPILSEDLSELKGAKLNALQALEIVRLMGIGVV